MQFELMSKIFITSRASNRYSTNQLRKRASSHRFILFWLIERVPKSLSLTWFSENACKEISANMLEILIRDFNRHHSNECQNLTICDEVSEAYISWNIFFSDKIWLWRIRILLPKYNLYHSISYHFYTVFNLFDKTHTKTRLRFGLAR